jgi:hypothetical protein
MMALAMTIDHGAQTDTDLSELWARIVFNMLVSNTEPPAKSRLHPHFRQGLEPLRGVRHEPGA